MHQNINVIKLINIINCILINNPQKHKQILRKIYKNIVLINNIWSINLIQWNTILLNYPAIKFIHTHFQLHCNWIMQITLPEITISLCLMIYWILLEWFDIVLFYIPTFYQLIYYKNMLKEENIVGNCYDHVRYFKHAFNPKVALLLLISLTINIYCKTTNLIQK